MGLQAEGTAGTAGGAGALGRLWSRGHMEGESRVAFSCYPPTRSIPVVLPGEAGCWLSTLTGLHGTGTGSSQAGPPSWKGMAVQPLPRVTAQVGWENLQKSPALCAPEAQSNPSHGPHGAEGSPRGVS